MPKLLNVVLALLTNMIVLIHLPSAAIAQKRVALVIGNSAYQHTPKLTNPKNDATDMVAALKALGFQVVDGFDLDKAAFDRKVRDFATSLDGASVGVFFYAGHGLQVAGQNYLVPVDAQLTTAAALEFEMMKVDVIHRVMEQSTKTNVLFLDACRDNPLSRNLARSLGTRSTQIGKGLAPIESGSGTLISFSTHPGAVASDGAGRNSPYAGALVKYLSTSNDDLNAILIAVRNDVMTATQEGQVPWEHSALRGRLYFNPTSQTAEPAKVAPARLSEAAEAWGAAERSTSIAVLEAFIARYKETFYAEMARARIEELKKQQVAVATPVKPVEASSAMQSGRVFRDCPECPEMVVVPAGDFLMGGAAGEEGRSPEEAPQHKVSIAKPFAVGKYEISFAEWAACVVESGCAGNQNPADAGWGRGKRPVINVSWDDAMQYVKWLSKKTDKTYRLLTEAEWEYAARAGTTTPFSTGATISTDQANYGGEVMFGIAKKGNPDKTVEVGSFPGNAFGLHDMHGNVWEWVADCYQGHYIGAPTDGSAITSANCDFRIPRGGSWHGIPRDLRSAGRRWVQPDFRDDVIGFRVARTL